MLTGQPTRLGGRGWAVWTLAALWALWALIRVVGLERGWPLVPMISYTPFVAVATIIPLCLAMLWRRFAAAAVVTVGGLVLALPLLPRAIGGEERGMPGAIHLDVLSANIHLGGADLPRLVELVRETGTDVLAVQELTPEAAAELESLGLTRELPHAELLVKQGASGGAIFSRHRLGGLTPAPLSFKMPRARIEVPGAGEVEIVCVHPEPPIRHRIESWEAGLESLPAASDPGPLKILAGDFNATFDHARFREIVATGYRDAAEVTGEALVSTWPNDRRFPPPVTIDHVLAPEQVAVADFAVEDLPGSDHGAVYAELLLPPAR